MGQEIESSHFRQNDFQLFERRTRSEMALLSKWFDDETFDQSTTAIGMELEACIATPDGIPAPDNDAFLEAVNSEKVVAELSKFNFELNADPQPMTEAGLVAMERELDETWDLCANTAHQIGRRAILIGSMPTLSDHMLCLENLSSQNRYSALNEQVLRLRKGRPIPLDIVGWEELQDCHQDVMLEAATTSLQVHLQVPFSQSVAFYNAAIAASAFTVAVAANAPLLLGKKLWYDTRIPLFEQAVDTGPGLRRVSFGTAYAKRSLLEIFQENEREHAVILPVDLGEDAEAELAHIRLHNGTIWRWNRPLIGFDSAGIPHLRIEHRVMSAGPTIADSMANVAFSLGLITAIAKRFPKVEEQIPFEVAQDNFYRAAKDGWNAEIRWLDKSSQNLSDLLRSTIVPLAREGLLHLGFEDAMVDERLSPIYGRIKDKRNGADWQLAYINQFPGDLAGLVRAYSSHQSSNSPVHLWPSPAQV